MAGPPTSGSRGFNSKCRKLLGKPGAKKEEEEIDNYEHKRLQLCIECVPTRRILYIRIQYTFRISVCIGSLVQRKNPIHNTVYLLMSSYLI